MVMLGALIANQPVLSLEALEKALKEHLPSRHHHLLPSNYKALSEGAKFIAEEIKV
jgi:2-oxoglutarate ferredoxin oxidoreductase subunit gamma